MLRTCRHLWREQATSRVNLRDRDVKTAGYTRPTKSRDDGRTASGTRSRPAL
jgi:hypothetical protein